MQTSTLEELRYLLSAKQGFHNREYLHTPLVETGIPRGAITQICGYGKTEAAVQIIRDNPEFKTAWIESEFELNPLGVAQRNVDLTRILFAEAGEHMIWTCHQILKSHLFPIVVLKEAPMDDFLLRKLQLAAERSQTALVILTEQFSSSWPVSLMLKASLPHATIMDDERVNIEILRQRL
jgi:hypothetical protein